MFAGTQAERLLIHTPLATKSERAPLGLMGEHFPRFLITAINGGPERERCLVAAWGPCPYQNLHSNPLDYDAIIADERCFAPDVHIISPAIPAVLDR